MAAAAFNKSVTATTSDAALSAALAPAAAGSSRLWHNSGALAAALDAHWPSVRRLKLEQQRAVDAVLGGRDSLVVLSTGFGKSLCFQLPAAARPGLTIVLTPLVALADDQIGDLEGRAVSVARWDSSVSREDKDALLRELSPDDDGDFDADAVPRLLYCTPEALVHAEERHPKLAAALRGLVGRGLVNAIVVDECHCVSQWGHDFRDAYAQIGEARRRLGLRGVPVQALTATATPRVRDDVSKSLKLTEPVVVTATVDRPNIFLEVVDGDAIGDAEAELADLYEWITDNDGAGLVYACKREEVERIAAELSDAGVDAEAYHAGMEAGARARVAGGFASGGAPRVVVATIAFGMGINKSDVRWVVHWDLPKTLANLLQEMGRGGRDGQPAASRVYHTRRRRVTVGGGGGRGEGKALPVDSSIQRYCAAGARCRRALLLAHFGEPAEDGPPRVASGRLLDSISKFEIAPNLASTRSCCSTFLSACHGDPRARSARRSQQLSRTAGDKRCRTASRSSGEPRAPDAKPPAHREPE